MYHFGVINFLPARKKIPLVKSVRVTPLISLRFGHAHSVLGREKWRDRPRTDLKMFCRFKYSARDNFVPNRHFQQFPF